MSEEISLGISEFNWSKEAEKTNFSNRVVGIYVCPREGEPMQKFSSVQAVKGKGLVGDRYNLDIREGVFNRATLEEKRIPDEFRQISLISLQGIALANVELMKKDKPFSLAETRRNIVIDMGVDKMNALLGKEIKLGDTVIKLVDHCRPCARPSTLAKKANFEPAFQDRGGIRGQILWSGEINGNSVLEVIG